MTINLRHWVSRSFVSHCWFRKPSCCLLFVEKLIIQENQKGGLATEIWPKFWMIIKPRDNKTQLINMVIYLIVRIWYVFPIDCDHIKIRESCNTDILVPNLLIHPDYPSLHCCLTLPFTCWNQWYRQ